MTYIPVLGLKPSVAVLTPTTRYFNDYLVSVAEPTTSRGWSLNDIYRHMKHIVKLRSQFKEEYNPNLKLMIDSGGYQIITGYITESRIREYTDVYHFILEKFQDEIDTIFSLDINTPSFSQEMLKKYNDYSIDQSIQLLQKYPSIKNKQIFIIQSRVPKVLQEWVELMDDHKVYDHYTRYSFGGLVGLKKEIRSQFNHFVPMTLWLMTYLKNRGAPLPEQIHMLGQSSKLALITGAILEKITGINITMDSSEIVRFRPIEYSVPVMHKEDNVFKTIKNLDDMTSMLKYHSDPNLDLNEACINMSNGKVTNTTFVEIICQNINNINDFASTLVSTIPIEEIINWTKDDFINYHEYFDNGRLAVELENNMTIIKKLYKYFNDNDFDGIHTQVLNLISDYYSDNHTKKGLLSDRN